tara:strand:- start:318 stop:641 length:324 start_codon:yes stop_codon:yes gene_type:complete
MSNEIKDNTWLTKYNWHLSKDEGKPKHKSKFTKKEIAVFMNASPIKKDELVVVNWHPNQKRFPSGKMFTVVRVGWSSRGLVAYGDNNFPVEARYLSVAKKVKRRKLF